MGDALAKSFVWHSGKCFFVSTIDRDSSAMDAGRYAETLVWEYNYETKERAKIVGQGDDMEGQIRTHLAIMQRLHSLGRCEVEKD